MIATDDRVARFVSERVGSVLVPPYACMGLEREGQIIAGAVFNHFTGPDVHVTIAGHGWTRGFLAEVGHYVFDQLRAIRMTAITEQPAVVRLAEKLGGELEGAMRDHFGPGRDAFVVGLLSRDWKF